jgi:hypothetical protein
LFSGELEYGAIPVDVVAFVDAGVAWTKMDRPQFLGGARRVVRSVGGAIRYNLLGILAVELSASHPFDRIERGVKWQLGVRQGF